MTGSKAQLYNGITLLVVFFLCRVCWGPFWSFYVIKDVGGAYWNPPLTKEEGIPVPLWLAMAYLGSNLVLNSLNFYWFYRMILTVAKRFTVPAVKKEVIVVEGTEIEVPVVGMKVKKEL